MVRRGALAVAVVCSLWSATGTAQDLEEYRRFRQARFAEVIKANPDAARQIPQVKARTAVLVAQAGPKLAAADAPPMLWRVPTALPFILDNPVAPRMVIVPAGEFTFGAERGGGARRRVRIGQALAVGMFPVTFAEFAFFAAETRHGGTGGCVLPRATAPRGGQHDWRDPGFAQTFRSPVTCVALADARAYAVWLTRKTGHRYRLLSEVEYEYAQRGGTTTAFWWGDVRADGCGLANGWAPPEPTAEARTAPGACRDLAEFTAEVGTMKPNGFGLYDTTGNVAAWTADCWRPGDCRSRVARGASWATTDLRSAARRRERANARSADLGFRVAREL